MYRRIGQPESGGGVSCQSGKCCSFLVLLPAFFVLHLVFAIGPAPAIATAGASEVDEEEQEKRQNEIAFFISIVQQDKLDLSDRVGAARTLLDREWPNGNDALAALLEPGGDVTTQRAIAQALTKRPEVPPARFAKPLEALLMSAQSPLLEDVAGALGRMGANGVTAQMARLALDQEASFNARRGAILALGQMRTRQAASTLMELVSQNDAAKAVRQEAFRALARLSGIDEYGNDLDRWQRWWRKHQRMTDAQWFARLIESYARRNSELSERARGLVDRLVQTQRSVYLATPADQRQALLVKMLDDQLAPIRQLAVDLAGQLLVSPEGVGKELRQALRRHLDDGSVAVREGASRLLTDLFDEPAAKLIAGRLAENREAERSVLRNYLLMMSRLPQAEAVDAMVGMLDGQEHSDVATAALSKAIEADLLNDVRKARVLAVVRQRLAGDTPPAPGYIELLGRLGGESDWERIEQWLAHEDPNVRGAAARAWQQGDQSTAVLARRADDRAVQPFLYASATSRAAEPGTLRALVAHKPNATQLVEAWAGALVAICGRVEAPIVIEATQALGDRSAGVALRAQMLSAAIDRLRPAGTDVTALSDASKASVAELLLARAALLLEGGDAQAAQADIQSVDALDVGLSPAMKRSRDFALIGVRLLLDDRAGAAALAAPMLAKAGEQQRPAVQDALGEVFHVAASRLVNAGEIARAREVAGAYRELMGEKPTAEAQARIKAMDALIKDAAERGDGAPATGASTGESDGPALTQAAVSP